jgi:hypothetical protein
MANLETARPPTQERSFKYWEGRVYKLEERVYVLENLYRKRNEERDEVQKGIIDKLGSLDFRHDMLAANLVDVREMVTEIRAHLNVHDKRFDGVDKRFEGIEKTQAAHGEMLVRHGEMLRQILERLANPN